MPAPQYTAMVSNPVIPQPGKGLPANSFKEYHNGKVLRFFLPVMSVADTINRNNIMYPWEVLSNQNGWKWPLPMERMAAGNLYCRIGHPEIKPMTDPEEFRKHTELVNKAKAGDRNALTTLTKKHKELVKKLTTMTSAMSNSRIVRIYDNRPYLSATIETLANQDGEILRDQIKYNQLIPGYSLCAMVALELFSPGNNQPKYFLAKPPSHVINCDYVEEPACPDARPQNPYTMASNITKGWESVPVPSLDTASSGMAAFGDYAIEELKHTETIGGIFSFLEDTYSSTPCFAVFDNGDPVLMMAGDSDVGRLTLMLDQTRHNESRMIKSMRSISQDLLDNFWV